MAITTSFIQVLRQPFEPAQYSWRRLPRGRSERLEGELLWLQGPENGSRAERLLQEAIDIAEQQDAKSLELRAATSLARLWARQGERRRAHDVVTPIYGWFTEGFDTPNLKVAKALLDELR